MSDVDVKANRKDYEELHNDITVPFLGIFQLEISDWIIKLIHSRKYATGQLLKRLIQCKSNFEINQSSVFRINRSGYRNASKRNTVPEVGSIGVRDI